MFVLVGNKLLVHFLPLSFACLARAWRHSARARAWIGYWEIDQRVNQRLFAESRGSREREDAGTGTSIGKFVADFSRGV